MDRGLRAQLSPNEETTFRRVMSGADQDNLRFTDLAHLVSLGLIEADNGVWRLTNMGLQRAAIDHREIQTPTS